MKRAILLAGLLSASALTTGCATILSDDTQKINIATTNNKAITAMVDGKSVSLPGVVEVTRKNQDLMVTTSDADCTSSTAAGKSVNSMFWVNILSGGPFGSSTDYGTEKMWQYDENIMIHCK